MLNKWNCHITFKNRYVCSGITKHILKYSDDPNKKLRILDVGCSTGKAIAKCKSVLFHENNLELVIIGIDDFSWPSRIPRYISRLVSKANSNLDVFIRKDILDVDNKELDECDIIICANIFVGVNNDVKQEILNKCVQFLKSDGILITNGIDSSLKDQLLSLDDSIGNENRKKYFYKWYCDYIGLKNFISINKSDLEQYVKMKI